MGIHSFVNHLIHHLNIMRFAVAYVAVFCSFHFIFFVCISLIYEFPLYAFIYLHRIKKLPANADTI